MFSLTWDYLTSSQSQISVPQPAQGIDSSLLYSSELWNQWIGLPANLQAFEYDWGSDKRVDNILLYNVVMPPTATVRLVLYDGSGSLVFDHTWIAGVLTAGFSIERFGIAGFGGVDVNEKRITPYNVFYKIIDGIYAKTGRIEINNIGNSPLSIGFLGLGTAYSPSECSVENFVMEYMPTTKQNQSIAGVINGVDGFPLRKVKMTVTLINYDDLKEFIQLIVSNNVSKPFFFALAGPVNYNDSFAIQHAKTMAYVVLSFMAFFDMDSFPSYALDDGVTSKITLTLKEGV